MRVLLTAFLVAPVCGCGVLNPYKSCGFRVEFIDPPTLSAPMVVNQSGNTLGVAGVGTGPAVGLVRPAAGIAAPSPCDPPMGPVGPRMTTANGADCTLDDCCRRLEALEAKVSARPTLPKPMPVGPPNPQ